jgi:hypothetical protein
MRRFSVTTEDPETHFHRKPTGKPIKSQTLDETEGVQKSRVAFAEDTEDPHTTFHRKPTAKPVAKPEQDGDEVQESQTAETHNESHVKLVH